MIRDSEFNLDAEAKSWDYLSEKMVLKSEMYFL